MSKKVSSGTLRSQLSLNNIITVVLGLVVLVVINYLGYRHYYHKDLSRNKYYQLSEKTVQVLKSLKEPVHIITCLTTSQIKAEIDNLIKEYEYVGGKNIKVDSIDPALDLDKAEKLAQKYKLDLRENLVIFEYKDQFKYLSESQLADFDPGNPMTGQPGQLKDFKGEQQFTASILALVEGKPSKVYFLAGHGEREIGSSAPGAIGTIETGIKRDNNLTDTLNLATASAVPEDCDLLVDVGPKTALSQNEVEAISNYLDKNGKVIILQDPEITSGLETVIQKYGMDLQPDLIIMKEQIAGIGDMLLSTAIGVTYAEHPAVNALQNLNLQMPEARSVSTVKDSANPNVSKVTLLVKTPASPTAWGETNFNDKKPTYDPATDFAGPLAMAAVYDGGEVPGEGVKVTGARLVVIGSSTFLANQYLDGVGADFFLNIVNWMLKKEISIGISPKLPQEFGLNVSPLQSSTICILALTVIPLIALISGIVMWFSRRK